MIKDVLGFVPVYRLEPETVTAVCGMQWHGAISWLFQRDNPYSGTGRKTGILNHWHQYRRGRETFLHGRYDALFVIESDIIPPPDALERLAALDTDLAYGAYMFRTSNVVNIYERYQNGALNIGESLSVHAGKWDEAKLQGVIPCSGAGLGCVLIKRHVLEAIEFRITSNPGCHCDTWFTNDVYDARFTMMADTGVVCGHKREDGVVLWPE